MPRCDYFACVKNVMITTNKLLLVGLRKSISLIGLLIFAVNTWAQQIESRSGVILRNGNKELGRVIIYEGSNATGTFTLDGKKFPSGDVTFFKSAHGYFANASDIDCKECYGLRLRKGNISLFEKINIATYQADTLPNSGRLSDFASGERMHYYQLENNSLKKINYANLKDDIYSYIPSQLFLKDYRKFRFMQFGMLGIGIGLVASSIISQGSNINITPGMVLGTLLTGGSFGAIGSQRESLENAIKAFNEKDTIKAKDTTP